MSMRCLENLRNWNNVGETDYRIRDENEEYQAIFEEWPEKIRQYDGVRTDMRAS